MRKKACRLRQYISASRMLFSIIALMCAIPQCYAESIDDEIESVTDYVVKIDVSFSDGGATTGFGLVMPSGYKDKDGKWVQLRIFIVTANHVVRENSSIAPDHISVSFKNGVQRDATITPFYDSAGDLAALEMPVFDRDWQPVDTSRESTERGHPFKFLGRDGQWYEPTNDGVVNSSLPDGKFIMDQTDVSLGSSGAPVFGTDGLAGLVLKKVGVDSALVSPIVPLLRLMRESGVIFDTRSSRALDYVDASAVGAEYIKKKEEKAQADYPDEPGDFSAGQPFLFAARYGGVRSYGEAGFLLLDWQASGVGGGNHYEEYLSLFRIDADGKMKGPPIEERIVGGYFGGSYSFDLAKTGVTIDTTSIYPDGYQLNRIDAPSIIVTPGCYDRFCEKKRDDRQILLCPKNTKHKFVSGEVNAGEDERWQDMGDYLGFRLGGDPRLFAGDTISNAGEAGLEQGQQYLGWPVYISDTKRAALSGIQNDDFIVSMGERTSVSWSDFECSIMDSEDDYGRVVRPFEIKVIRGRRLVQLTFNPPQ